MSQYTVTLSKVRNYSRRKRAKKAMAMLREQVEKREGEEVSVDPEINHELWKDGVENPPKKLEVEVVDTGDGKVVRLPDTGTQETQTNQTEETDSETEDEQTEETDYEGIFDGTVGESKEAVEELEDPDYEKLLELEKEGKDRKTLKEFLESKM